MFEYKVLLTFKIPIVKVVFSILYAFSRVTSNPKTAAFPDIGSIC
jgi:hypothetical protein